MAKQQSPLDWERELDLERELRKSLAATGQADPGQDQDLLRKASRAWFAQVNKVLDQWVRMHRDHRTRHQPPDELLIVLSSMANELSRGNPPKYLNDVVGRGRRPMGQTEEAHIGFASAYLQAVANGLIDDTSPVKTIQDAYGVERQVVQRWKDKQVPASIADLVRDPVILTAKMRSSGEFYRTAGRSKIAIKHRGVRPK